MLERASQHSRLQAPLLAPCLRFQSIRVASQVAKQYLLVNLTSALSATVRPRRLLCLTHKEELIHLARAMLDCTWRSAAAASSGRRALVLPADTAADRGLGHRARRLPTTRCRQVDCTGVVQPGCRADGRLATAHRTARRKGQREARQGRGC
eukprot:5368062-Pleurochrysis_carterae.AAC.3